MNLLSHSPVNTPCPGFRYSESREALLDEAAPLVSSTRATTYNVEGRADVLCPVQVHVHDPTIRERRRSHRSRNSIFKRKKTAAKAARTWIDLEDSVLDGYIYIDDECLESGVTVDEEAHYPPEVMEPQCEIQYGDQQSIDENGDNDDADVDQDDNNNDDTDNDDADSHTRAGYLIYDRFRYAQQRSDADLSITYPLANSHGNSYLEWSSHNKYADLRREVLAREFLKSSKDDLTDYSVANSHDSHTAISAENRDRSYPEESQSDQSAWDSKLHANYEIANSHSNYRVYYDSQMQQEDLLQAPTWSPEHWRERFLSSFAGETSAKAQANEVLSSESAATKSSEPKTKTESCQVDESACDIEQCLVQIEESLLNIEQNLLHVQDLDIPELRNLLYKSPSIERSLYEVQDILYADGIVPVIQRSKSLESEDGEEEDEEEEEEEEDIWLHRNLTIKDNNDDDGDNGGDGPLNGTNEKSSETDNVGDRNPSNSIGESSNTDYGNDSSVPQDSTINANFNIESKKNIHFIPNSLNKTLTREIVLDETKDNIRLSSSEPDEHPTIDYNLNCVYIEKKAFLRDKCHSRTTSLDENTTFHNSNFIDKYEAGKTSLQSLHHESVNNCLNILGKAKSEGTLQSSQGKSLKDIHIHNGMAEMIPNVEDKMQHSKISIAEETWNCGKSGQDAKDSMEQIPLLRPREKSPRPRRSFVPTEKSQDKDKETPNNKPFDKKKRKKLSVRTHNPSESALVPSKLISLSLSLLLAALLQAVRCLTDLVEDAFRSVSYDRTSLLQ